MKTHASLVLLINWFCFAAFDSYAAEKTEEPIVRYLNKGSHGPYQSVEVTVFPSGKTLVVLKKHSKTHIDYETKLSLIEMNALNARITASGFFTDKSTAVNPPSLHEGVTELTIKRAADTKTVSFGRDPSLEPLCFHLWRLCVQAEAINALNKDGDVYTATGCVNQRLAGAKALQPERLREPLIAYVKRCQDRQRIEWAMAALGWILTPEELLGLVAGELKRADRQGAMPVGLPGDLSEAHAEALCVLYLSFVQENLGNRAALSNELQNTFDGCLQGLGHYRCQAAIPLFIKLFDQATQHSLHPDVIPLAQMGTSGLHAILPYLESSNALQRGYAIELFRIAARGNPASKFSNPYSKSEYDQMIPVLKQVVTRLGLLQGNDPSAEVRDAAAQAIAEITSEISK